MARVTFGATGGRLGSTPMSTVSRIALYYRFVPLADPEAVRLWQRTLLSLIHI